MSAEICIAGTAFALLSLNSAGCACMDGGPGCGGDPSIEGICEPRIEVGTEVDVTVVYQTDTSPAPSSVDQARTGDADIASVVLGAEQGSLVLVGNDVGTTAVELVVDGWEDRVWFTLSVEAAAPDYVCDDRAVPGFDITGRGSIDD